jgi:hypothetical protein
MRIRSSLLWWLHSLYALAVGIGVMWVGATHYALLRLVILYVAFVWVTSLAVPVVLRRGWVPARWRGRVHAVVNYFHRNVYQQILFFLLPLYYASATGWSANMAFVGVLAATALLSTLDVVYDRHVSVGRTVGAAFFSFNLFASVNAMLPVVWHISNAASLPASALLALVAFATVAWQHRGPDRRPVLVALALSAALLFGAVTIGRSAIPPAPLCLVESAFGTGVDRRAFGVTSPLVELDPAASTPVVVSTSVRAPLGLRDRVAHRWYVGTRLVYASPFYTIEGGREQGYRLWTSCRPRGLEAGSRIRVDVVTEAGQLVGRAELPVRPGPTPPRSM